MKKISSLFSSLAEVILIASLLFMACIPSLTLAQTPANFCFTFTRDLGISKPLSLQEAVALKEILMNEGFWNANSPIPTYNSAVALAVSRFQEKYASQILTPNHLSHGTGFVGPSTRTKLNALYGCGTASNINTPCGQGALFNTLTGAPCSSTVSPISGCFPGALFSVLSGESCSVKLPEGCTSSAGYSTTTGVRCAPEPVASLPAGCSSTNGFSVTTGTPCNGQTPSSTPTPTPFPPIVVTHASTTLVVSLVPLLSGGTVHAGKTVPISYLQITNVGKEPASLKGFWLQQNGSAPAQSIIGLSTVDDTGTLRNFSGGIEGSTPFTGNSGFAPSDNITFAPGQMRLFTIKTTITHDVTLYLGTQLKIDVTSIDTNATSVMGRFPIHGTTWTIAK
ncbi:MAG: hypothetical protein PHV93_04355 [Candidatus Pacebacteria bacterium]|nr:hypothetical protein [Candidatus Paceibacterota bacterium]